MKLLPSQQDWVNSVRDALLDGELVLLRGAPSSGKTILLEAVARELANTSVITGGRSYTEQNQSMRREEFQRKVRDSLREHGTAHLFFDDYPHALQWSQGLQLQRRLLHLLVDGEWAMDIGALLTGRWARSMHLVSSGSPLVPRAKVVQLPRPDARDFDAAGCPRSMEGTATVGGNTALLAKITPILGKPSLRQVRDAGELLAPHWVADAPWDAVRWMKSVIRQGPGPLPDDTLTVEALAPHVFETEDGRYDVVNALKSAPAVAALNGRAPTWPTHWQDSVATFCSLLDGAPAVIWVDRYLAVDPAILLKFLQDVRRACATKFQILVAKDKSGHVDTKVVNAFAALDCEIRTMHRGDRKQLHDRHLIYLGGRQGGVVMPTGGVVMCQHPPGAAMAVQAPLLDNKLILEAWGRGGRPG